MNYNEMKASKEIDLESENIDTDSYFCLKQEFREELPILEINEDMNFVYEIKNEYFLNHFINCFNMDINQIQKENTETRSSSLIVNQNKINKKLSGRKRKTEIKEGDFIHNKNAVDNIERKLKCHSINSLIDATNELISLKFNQKYKFLKILYALIKDVSEKEMNSLKQRSIGEILQQEISRKYSKKYPNNKNIYEIVKKDKDIKEFLNKIYIDIFRNNYYANNKRIKFGDSYIELKKMKTLEDFFREKNLNNEEDKKRVNEVIEKKYLTSKMKILKSKN